MSCDHTTALQSEELVQLVHKHGSCYLKDGGSVSAEQRGLSLIKADLVITASECPGCKSQRRMLSPRGAPSCKETKQTLSRELITCVLSTPEEDVISLDSIDTYSRHKFSFPAYRD